VTYNPNITLLKNAVESLLNQVDYAILIDNSSNISYKFQNDKIITERLGINIGIAAAQNIGIRKAIEYGAEYIILSDQDTVYPGDYVRCMLPVFSQFPNACVVVPRFVDVIKKREDGFIANRPIFFHRFFPYSGKHQILQGIASGKVLKVSSLDQIGLMNEKLFIDWVDLEWCWRARTRGFQVIGNADVVIKHQLGETSKDLFFLEVNLRSAMRHYYITRNAFYLALYSRDLDFGHRIILFIKSFRYIAGFTLLSKPHLVHAKAVLYGFYHGIVARLGRYDLD